jgi:hypothetical protein
MPPLAGGNLPKAEWGLNWLTFLPLKIYARQPPLLPSKTLPALAFSDGIAAGFGAA